MNCKQGDMAIVIKGASANSPNIGRVVTCLKLHPAGYMRLLVSRGVVWEVDRDIATTHGKFHFMYDAWLRPLRGDLSGDETDTETPIIREAETC